MEEQQNSENYDDLQRPKPKARKWRKISAYAAVFVLIAGLGSLSYLYQASNKKANDRSKEIFLLNEKLNQLELADPGEAATETSAQPANCKGGSEYKAEVGKFSVKLDSPKVIIRLIDGGFEGGPITDIEIGTCLDGEKNVVDQFPPKDVKIIGHPELSSTELRNQKQANGFILTADGTVTIDGVSASKFTSAGLFDSVFYYFDKSGIGYEIELVGDSSSMFNDIKNDWKFSP